MHTGIFAKTDNIKDITIIGSGIAGVSIAYYFAKKAKELDISIKIRVIEQAEKNQVPNPVGSSFGTARITRVATAEGEQYIPYAKRSQEIVKDLENLTGEELYIRSGGLIVGPNHEKAWPKISYCYAQKNQVPSEIKTKSHLSVYGALNLEETEVAYFEETMGMLLPQKCHEVLIKLAEQEGVEFIFSESYSGFDEKKFYQHPLIVHTNKNSYPTDRLILAMGPWIQQELSKSLKQDVSEQLSVHQSTMYTFKITKEALKNYEPKNCPVIIWQTGEAEAFVFFPDVDNSGTVQFAIFPITDLSPSSLTPEIIQNKIPLMPPDKFYEEYVKPHFIGISSECVSVKNYPYTMNRREAFIYDRLPGHPKVCIVDPGSGHGYKHVFAFGEQIAEHLLLNESKLKIEETFGSFFVKLEETLRENSAKNKILK